MKNPLAWLVDVAVSVVDPVRGVKRARARKILSKRSSYDAGKSNEIFRNFSTTSNSADADLSDVGVLRQRSRAAHRNAPAGRSAIEARMGNVVSTGIDLEPKTGNDEDDKKMKEVWKLWSEQADASGKCNLKELQRLCYRSELLNGSNLIQIVMIKDDPERLIPHALHVLEADQLSPDPVRSISPGNRFANGVETDKYGRPVYYHIIDHPGDSDWLSQFAKKDNVDGRRIPAAEIIHTYQVLRPGQSVGEPVLVPSLKRLVQEEELIEAELQSAVVGSAFAALITSKSPLEGGLSQNDEDDTDDKTDDEGNELTQITSGTIGRLDPDEDLKILANNRPSQAIDPFRKMLHGDVAAATGISRVDLDKDYAEANYSSMRADMLDKRRMLTPEQNRFGRAFLGEIYKRIFNALAVAAQVNVIPSPRNAVERLQYLRQRRYALNPDGWAYVDPVKDVTAALMAIKGGLSNYERELASQGADWREIHEQLSKELDTDLIQKLLQIFEQKDPNIEEILSLVAQASGKKKGKSNASKAA